jgi:hypothetical protein
MKKSFKLSLILGMILLGNNAFCQTSQPDSVVIKDVQRSPKTYLDLLLNIVSTNLNYGNSNSALEDYKKSVLGAQIGVSFQAGITPEFSLVSEFYFTTKGGKLKANNPLTTSSSKLLLYVFELPVLARFHFSDFHINAGPSIAYNFYGTRKIGDSSADLSFNRSEEGFKRFDAGIQMGGGYTFHTKRKRITVDLRYNYGLTNISYGQEMYNRSLIISVHISNPWKTNPFGKN